MKLKLPIHIQDRIQKRDLQIDHIKKAIREPDFKETVFNGRTRVRKKIDDKKAIEVIYCKEGFRDTPNQFLVITAYYQ